MAMQNRDVHSLPYMPQLDGLRAIAILAVLYHHYEPKSLVTTMFSPGELGVRLFFVLSGFLITTILLRDCAATSSFPAAFLSFMRRRMLRLYPVLLVTLLVGAALDVSRIREMLLWSLTYTVNFWIAWYNQWPDGVSHLWTLANEEQFYLIWPAILFFTPPRFLRLLLIVSIPAATAYRCAYWIYGGENGTVHLANSVLPISVFDALALGCLLAIVRDYFVVKICGLVGAAGYMLAKIVELSISNPHWAGAANEISTTAICFAFTWLVWRSANDGLPAKIFSNPALTYIGKISYGLYIIHVPVMFWLGVWGGSLTLKISALVTTFGLAILSWHLIERPILRRKTKQTAVGLAPCDHQ